MTTTQQFIEDAIKGGWSEPNVHLYDDQYVHHAHMCVALLDPLAWKAVGKTRGWEDGYPDRVYEAFDTFFYQLYNGDSIEEALEKISN